MDFNDLKQPHGSSLDDLLSLDFLAFFEKNSLLVPDNIKPIILNEKFFKDNDQLVKEDTFISKVIRNGGTNYVVPPINGKNYHIYINTIIGNLKQHNLLTKYDSELAGLMLSPGAFSLVNIKPELDYFISSGYLYPFEFSTDYEYLVISIYGDEDGTCQDDSFSSITILKNEKVITTYIRIADKSGRWSEWLELTDDVELNINYYKIYLEYRKLLNG